MRDSVWPLALLGMGLGAAANRIEFPAEVAQLVEQWSEELRSTSFHGFSKKLAPDTCFTTFGSNSLAAT